jgi:hypothetical protein
MLILNSMFMTKKQFDEQVEILKGLSVEIFYGIIEYNKKEIDNCFFYYSVKNQDIEETIHDISHELRHLEDELFNIKIKHEINVAPMKNYIEERYKKTIDKLTKEVQEATIESVSIIVNEENKKDKTSK